MTDKPDEPTEKKDPLTSLGKKTVSKDQSLPDIYSFPEIAEYLKFKLNYSKREVVLLDKIESAALDKGGEEQYKNLSTIIRSLASKELVGHSNFLRVKSEIVWGGLADDKDLRTATNDIDGGEVKGSS